MTLETRGGVTWAPVGLVLGLALASASAVQAQGGRRGADYEAPAELDPYTRGEAEALEEAGYVSFGPFPWGDGHDTRSIAEVLGRPVLWVETAHFRLGSTLWSYRMGDDREEKRKLRGELERLRARLPNVPSRVRELDPWLRLHLYAQRLEEVYARFCEDFGVADVDFPSVAVAERRHPMGRGPYLGMREKYAVLLTEKQSTLGRYTGHFLRATGNATWRHYFPETGAFFAGTAAEFLEGPYENDTALHCSLAFALVQNLVDGFRGYTVVSPLWLKEGLGHAYVRRIDPRFPLFSGSGSSARDRKRDEDWEPKVRGRVEHEYFPKALEMFAWSDPDDLELSDHHMVWARVDFLLRAEPGAGREFLFALKEPPSADASGAPGPEELVQRQVAAVQRAWGLDPAGFDRAWSAWVLREYARR